MKSTSPVTNGAYLMRSAPTIESMRVEVLGEEVIFPGGAIYTMSEIEAAWPEADWLGIGCEHDSEDVCDNCKADAREMARRERTGSYA